VAELGADWWRDPNAPFVDDFSNNPGAGSSDWVKLTTEWKNLYFTTLSPQQLQADPPPGLQTVSPLATTPTVTQAAASPATAADTPATGTTTASASQSFALLNQHLAGNTGRVDPGQIVAAVSPGANWHQDSFLTRPQL
jgi:hypothetical protein